MSEPTRKSDIIEDGVLTDFINQLDKADKKLREYDESLKKTAKTMKNEFSKVNKDTIQGMEKIYNLQKQAAKETKKKRANQKSLNTVEQERLKLQKNLEKAQAKKILAESEENKRLQKLRIETNKINKAERDREKQAERNKNAYTKLSDESRRYKNESKRLGAELLALEKAGKGNTDQFNKLEKEYKQVTNQARTTDAQLKKLDSTVGDNFRNVGNYQSALDGVKGSLMSVAGALGLGGIGAGFFKLNKDLSQATNQARMFFDVSDEGAKTIAQDATLIAKAYDKDINEVLRTANVLQEQFGISGEQALEKIETGIIKGADVSGEFLENLNEYSTQLRLAGLNADEAISILTQSEQRGVFSDKGVDAIKEATLSLREMTPPAKEALDAIGMSAEQVQKDIASGSKSYFDVIQEISNRTREVGEDSQAAGMILADVFKGAGEDAGDFILELGDLDKNIENLEDTNKGFEGSIQNITKSFYEFLFGVNEAGGVMDKLAGTINFVADNFSTIVTVLGKLLGFYLVLIARQKIINSGMLDFAKNLFKAKTNQQGLNSSMKDGSSSASKFGSALKGIGWSVLIAFAIDLGKAFYDIATGAARARYESEQLEKAQQRIGGANLKTINAVNKALEEQLTNIRRKRELNEISAKEAEEQRQQAIKSAKQTLKSEEDANKQRERSLKGRIEVLQQLTKQLNQVNAGVPLSQEAIADLMNEYGFSDADNPFNLLSKAEADLKALQATTDALESEQEKLNSTSAEFEHQFKSNSKATKTNTKETKKNTKEKKIQKVTLQDINDILRETRSLREGELNEEQADELQQENERINKRLTERLTMINNFERKGTLTEEEASDQRLIAEIDALNERKKVLEQYGQDTTQIKKEISEKQLELSKRADEKEKELEEKQLERQKELQKERLELLNQTQKAITEALTNQIDQRISLLDREAQAAKEQQDYLKGLAESGDIDAQQSITEERERELAALREKERLEKQKATLELISSGLEVFSNQIENGASPQEALAQTVLTTGALTDFLSNLNFFAKGTDNAPAGPAVVGEEGAEAIFSRSGKPKGLFGQKGAELTNLSAGDKVLTAPETIEWMQGNAMMNSIEPMKQDTAGNSYDLLRQDMQTIAKEIKNKPTHDYDIKRVAKGVMEIMKESSSGGDKHVSRHRVRY